MNAFRFTADMLHLTAMLLLLAKLWQSKSSAGLSALSQVLFALVYTTRYLDLFLNFFSIYNTTMKITYISITYTTVLSIYLKFKETYDRKTDPHLLAMGLVILSTVLALVFNHEFQTLEIFWTFSIYLESVAILPQLYVISKTGRPEAVTVQYLTFLGMYRALYIVNWIYRYYTQGYFDMIAIGAGCVQTFLYIDFLYLYITKETITTLIQKEEKLNLITNI
ncbi:unnamed protein product [Clavelina lepadiformis]|uniref:ER lumen protein-retaining receptor n=1 Tax=Clavelina lepadiformis TaxID=159417 RepID=A0ABP0EW09_CLALP